MPHYKLTYFDFDGGRGEPIRIALHAAGIAFEDHRLSSAQFSAMRESTPFNALPVLEIDGVSVTQSNALCRYVGRLAGLYPEDAMQALYCDEVMDAQEDFSHHISATFGLKGDALRLAREKLVAGSLSVFVRGLGQLLARGGGRYFAGNALTMADLKTFFNTRWLRSGVLDHVPTDLVQRLAPGLVEHQERVASDPRVVAWYASRR
jgi:prostaglandin-H2 D-isomerase / glutathione transferase